MFAYRKGRLSMVNEYIDIGVCNTTNESPSRLEVICRHVLRSSCRNNVCFRDQCFMKHMFEYNNGAHRVIITLYEIPRVKSGVSIERVRRKEKRTPLQHSQSNPARALIRLWLSSNLQASKLSLYFDFTSLNFPQRAPLLSPRRPGALLIELSTQNKLAPP